MTLHAINCEVFYDVLRTEPVIDLCVGVNPLQEKFLMDYGFKPDRLTTIVHGVPLPDLTRQPALRSGQPLRILFVGRLSHLSKRVLDLAPLVEELFRRAANFCLTVVGSGEDEAQLRERLQPHVLTGRVNFKGYVTPDELNRSVYPAHDALIVLSPALGEAGPLVIQEAMAHGVVPVSSEYLGIHSLGFVRSGQTGFIYPCGDLSRAADCLRDLASDSLLLRRMSQACLAAAGEFSLEIVHQKWLEALDQLSQWPPRVLSKDLKRTGLEPEAGESRLDRLLSPEWADRVRRLLRRWPEHPDGWAEWPGTMTHADDERRVAVMADLLRLDGLAQVNRDAVRCEA
jgi:glycosyltransferase involved in cell wall biosynthesis